MLVDEAGFGDFVFRLSEIHECSRVNSVFRQNDFDRSIWIDVRCGVFAARAKTAR